ncbi:MAG: glycoside hydrolase family 95 protein [Paraprevotella sp.]|nr:glycoside hydrolase family 95 protein [Paraprevotella sp.]
MKYIRLLFLWSFLFPVALAVHADEYEAFYPEFSSGSVEHWYFIRFKKMGYVVQDMGDGMNLMTKNMARDKDEQLWKFVGSREDGYLIQSKAGHYMQYAAGENRYKSTSDREKAVLLYAAPSLNKVDPYRLALELTRDVQSKVRFNQMQGGGVDKTINEYSVGETNPLEFISASEADFPVERLDEVSFTSSGEYPDSPHVLWYRQPSTNWMTSSLPIGNGQLGAMVYGGIRQDEVQFNEKTLCTGTPCKDGDYFTGMRGFYQNFGSLFINTEGITEASDYRRELDMQQAVARVVYTANGVKYKREYLSSAPDGAIVIHYTADQPGSISLCVFQEDAHQQRPVYKDNTITVNGRLETVSFSSRLKVVAQGGEMTASSGGGIRVALADEVTIVLKGGTDYDPLSPTYTSNTDNFAAEIAERVDEVAAKTWSEIYDAHVADFRSYFDRVSLQLTTAPNDHPTDKLAQAYSEAVKQGGYGSLLLEQMYYHYGRYLLISSSRGVISPANLQGIWNNSNTPPWSSDIHANINVQMNYWPAEPTNLSDLHKIFLDYNYNEAIVQPQWQANAYYAKKELVRKLYGDAEAEAVTPEDTRGWVLYTANNIFGGGGTFMMNNVSANAWNCMHLWQHYRYTLDRAYLLSRAYPVMKACCEFWMDRLIEDRGAKQGSNPHVAKDYEPDGTLVAPLEYSPENGPAAEDGVAHVQQLCWDLFNNTLQAMAVLGEDVVADKAFQEELKAVFDKLDAGIHIDDDGYLREWKYSERTAGENQHRHNSHLIGLYPGNQISAQKDKAVFDAAVKSLAARGDGGTSWSIGWKINLWARALDAEHAYKIVRGSLNLTENTNNGGGWGGGIYANLLSAGPPFQIDGNFGVTAGMTEMLLQSYTDTIAILPALPANWAAGSVRGLCAVGGFEVDMQWEDHEITSVALRSKHGQECKVFLGEYGSLEVTDKSGMPVETTCKGQAVVFPTEEGGEYTLHFADRQLKPVWTTAFFPVRDEKELTEGAQYILRDCFVNESKGDRSGYVAVASPMGVTKGMENITEKSVFTLAEEAGRGYAFRNEAGSLPATGTMGGGLEPGTGDDYFSIAPCEDKPYHFNLTSTANGWFLNANVGSLTFWNENPHPWQIYPAQSIPNQGVQVVTLSYEDVRSGQVLSTVEKTLFTGAVPAYGEMLAHLPEGMYWLSVDGHSMQELSAADDPYAGLEPAGDGHTSYVIGVSTEEPTGVDYPDASPFTGKEERGDVYHLNGQKVREQVTEEEFRRDAGIPRGLYLMNGKKMVK